MSKKFGNYFPHYSNSRNDTKIIDLIRKYGHAGYGYFFMMLEIIREQPGFKYPLSNLGTIAYDIRIDVEVVRDIVHNSGLFKIDENMFFSPNFIKNMAPLMKMSEGGKKGMKSRYSKRLNKGLDNPLTNPLANRKETKETKEINNTYNTFYKSQIEIAKASDSIYRTVYPKFVNFLLGENETNEPLYDVLYMKYQLRFEDYCRLKDKMKLIKSSQTLDKMIYQLFNNEKYFMGKQSLYLTLNDWIDNEVRRTK